jgi:hypothetical protein
VLAQKVGALRKRAEGSEAKLRDARRQSAEAIRALRKAEDLAILGELSQSDLDRARKAAAEAITALAPIETDLSNDSGILARAEELLREQIERDQAAAARELLAEHALFRRDLATALPGLLALIERGIEIETRMKAECPRAMIDLWRRAGAGSRSVVAPQLAIIPLAQWLDDLRFVHPEDVGEAGTTLLIAKDEAAAAAAHASWKRGEKSRAEQDSGRSLIWSGF